MAEASRPVYALGMRILLTSVLVLGLSACSSGGGSAEPKPDESSPSRTASPSQAPDPPQPDASATKACAEVRAGVDAFNTSDFRATVAHFRLALPLAKAQALTDSSDAADDLVEAVSYYAELAPEDYPESARSSEDFAKYKTITLGQCVTPEQPLKDGGPSESPGIPA